MAQTSVAQFASELKVQPTVLLEQLKAAGVKEIPMLPSELIGRAVLTELVDSKKTKLAEKNQRAITRITQGVATKLFIPF